jgi:hypothetical protein
MLFFVFLPASTVVEANLVAPMIPSWPPKEQLLEDARLGSAGHCWRSCSQELCEL